MTPETAVQPDEFGPAYHGVYLFAHEDDWGWTAHGHHEPRRMAAACIAQAREDRVLADLRDAEIGLGDLLVAIEHRWAVVAESTEYDLYLRYCEPETAGAFPVTVVVP